MAKKTQAPHDFFVVPIDDPHDPILLHDNVIGVPRVFIDSWDSDKPYQIYYGSRYSAKTWTVAIKLLLAAANDTYFRCVFARHTQKATRESQFQLFKDLLKRYPLLGRDFTISEAEMKITHSNGHFLKGGSFEMPESLMGVPELTHFWVDEPISRQGAINRQSFLDIRGTLRNEFGITPKVIFSFNPISKNNFIYEDFFLNKIYDAEIVLSNYYHNPWCAEDSKNFLNVMKANDFNRWLVDGNGQWGLVMPEKPFFHGFNPKMVQDDIGVYIDEPLLLSFDFNVSPCTCLVIQVLDSTYGEEMGFNVVKEFQVEGGTSTLCTHIKSSGILDHEGGYQITGDRSGNNRSAASNLTNYEIILEEFDITKYKLTYAEGRNDRIIYSRDVCNYMLEHIPTRIDTSCMQTAIDLSTGEADDYGKIIKNRSKNHPQDAGDAFRYAVHAMFPNGVEDMKKFIV